jgi:D-alanyl-D-alanine carboxypeptidase
VSGWIIQLGATDDEAKANEILQRKAQRRAILAKASPFTEKIMRSGTPLYRARFSGFGPEDAQQACKALTRSGFSCFATKG